jgi:hypothetical protein
MVVSVLGTAYLHEAFARAAQEGDSLDLGRSDARKRRLRNYEARLL